MCEFINIVIPFMLFSGIILIFTAAFFRRWSHVGISTFQRKILHFNVKLFPAGCSSRGPIVASASVIIGGFYLRNSPPGPILMDSFQTFLSAVASVRAPARCIAVIRCRCSSGLWRGLQGWVSLFHQWCLFVIQSTMCFFMFVCCA